MQELQQLCIVTKSEVIDDFENLINTYCEQYHIIESVPRRLICGDMVRLFRGTIEHKDDWIRKQIDLKFKSLHRVKNGEKRSDRIRKEKTETQSIKSTLEDVVHQTIDLVRKG